MSDSAAYSRSVARVVRACGSPADDRALRLEVIDEIRSTVGFDAYAWLLTDPATSVGTAPLADVPWLAELPTQIRLKYLTTVNRWTALGDAPVALLRQATGGELSQSPLWRDLLVRYDIGDSASVAFTDRFGCWGFLELWRLRGRPVFAPADAAYLADIAGPLTTALRRAQAATFVVRPGHDSPRPGPVVLLLSPELAVRGQTPQTQEYLRVLVPPAQHHAPVPASAYNVAAQLLAVEAGVDDNPPSARVHLAEGLWVTLRAARIGVPEPSAQRDIAVTIEEASTSERVDLFARAFGLTVRERELLAHLVTGGDTQEVASRMFVSANTVQDHLKSIFEKTSARSRRALLARALGS